MKLIRLKNHDYSSNGAYFVTILCKERNHFFGEVMLNENSQEAYCELSEIGKIASVFWKEIPEHFPQVKLDEFVIMPDHMHGIIWLYNEDNSREKQLNAFSKMISGSLSTIMNRYKGSVTRECRARGFSEFCWHPRFYDRIIRDEEALHNVRDYIKNNPEAWLKKYNKKQ